MRDRRPSSRPRKPLREEGWCLRDIRLGLEEEVFLTEPDRPTLHSLYYLARLLWTAPGFYYVHSDSNFARGRDLRQGLMSGVEVSTLPCRSPAAVVADLQTRRQALAAACGEEVLMVPLGHLVGMDAPTNTCGMHVHLGGLADPGAAYRRLARYLPLLALLTANAPYRQGRRWGISYRMACSYAIGPLQPDPRYRFQDLILSRRLGTVEARLFDPTWDLVRIRVLVECMLAVASAGPDREVDHGRYARLREQAARRGYTPELAGLYRELAGLCEVDERWFAVPPAEQTAALVERYGVVGAYSALDSAYRGGPLEPGRVPRSCARPHRVMGGLLGYYLPRLPYKARKAWREHREVGI